MPPFAGVPAAVAGMAAARSHMRAEEKMESKMQNVRAEVAKEMLSHVQGNLPPAPSTPDEALARVEKLNSPEILMQDPVNRCIAEIVKRTCEPRLEEYYRKVEGRSAVDRFFAISPVDPPKLAPIKEVLAYFPAVEHDSVVARLQILENAGLIDYYSRYHDEPIYSPRVWINEGDHHRGFMPTERLIHFLEPGAL